MSSSDIHVALSTSGWWFLGITCSIIAILTIGAVWLTWFSRDKPENSAVHHAMATGVIVCSGLVFSFASWGLAPKMVMNIEDVRSGIHSAYGVELSNDSIQKLGSAKYNLLKSYGRVVDIHGVSYQFTVSNGTIFLSD